ncbi:MAG: hypothetical protein PHV85_08810 [Desulfovibrionaceae bacterium]|nr:hypothetical protein [Desulfovibrionaceae bacterium]
MKLKVGVPYAKHGRITEATLKSLDALRACDGFDLEIQTVQGSAIARARNYMINNGASEDLRQRLEGFDWFLAVDADIAFELGQVKRLLAHGLDIVGGAYPPKAGEARITAGRFAGVPGYSPQDHWLGDDARGLQEVDWVGAGFLLMRRQALEAMDFPWFRHHMVRLEEGGRIRQQEAFEDFGLCINARRCGLKVFVDCDCRVRHVPHPNERPPQPGIAEALNGLLANREAIIGHLKRLQAEIDALRAERGKDQT